MDRNTIGRILFLGGIQSTGAIVAFVTVLLMGGWVWGTTPLGRALQRHVPITYAVPSVILAQFAVACAFAVRTMLVTFDQISPRCEQVALTLGCNRSQAFWRVALPEARRGV